MDTLATVGNTTVVDRGKIVSLRWKNVAGHKTLEVGYATVPTESKPADIYWEPVPMEGDATQRSDGRVWVSFLANLAHNIRQAAGKDACIVYLQQAKTLK